MRPVKQLLINMPEEICDGMTEMSREYNISRTRMVIEACRRMLIEKPPVGPQSISPRPSTTSKPTAKSNERWMSAETTDAPFDFFSNSGTGIS